MKKLFALLLALVMALSMTACGGGRTEPAPAATTPAAPADSGNAAAPAAPAAAGGFEAGATIGVSSEDTRSIKSGNWVFASIAQDGQQEVNRNGNSPVATWFA